MGFLQRHRAEIGFTIFIAILLATITMSILRIKTVEAREGKHRSMVCERICEPEPHRWRSQKLGWGAFEFRCYCDDGRWQVVP